MGPEGGRIPSLAEAEMIECPRLAPRVHFALPRGNSIAFRAEADIQPDYEDAGYFVAAAIFAAAVVVGGAGDSDSVTQALYPLGRSSAANSL